MKTQEKPGAISYVFDTHVEGYLIIAALGKIYWDFMAKSYVDRVDGLVATHTFSK